jgi:ribosomal-protein-alanine N-acetyltransferase
VNEMIETPRLALRPFTVADAAQAFDWFGDPEVMRFTPTGPDRSQEETRERLGRYCEHQATHGFSKWLIQEKSSGNAIGDSGLLVLAELGSTTDLGFRFAPAYWGRGLATEVAAGWICAAFDVLGLDRLTAFAHVDNVASLRVLEKVGFRRQRREAVMGMDSITHVLTAEEYRGFRGPANNALQLTRPALATEPRS